MLQALAPQARRLPPAPAADRPLDFLALRLRLDPLVFLKLQFFAATWDCVTGGFGDYRIDACANRRIDGGSTPRGDAAGNPADARAGGEAVAASDRGSGDGLVPLSVSRFRSVPQWATPDGAAFGGGGRGRRASRGRRRRAGSRGRTPILILTHPSGDPRPTKVDELLLRQTAGAFPWSVLLVAARGGATFARLDLRGGPPRSVPLAVEIDWASWAAVVEDRTARLQQLVEQWQDEYARHVRFADGLPGAPRTSEDARPGRPIRPFSGRLFGRRPVGGS